MMTKTTSPTVETPEVTELSAKTAKLVEGVRATFTSFSGDYLTLRKHRDTFAPKFIKAYEAWKEETKGTFVGFVRLLDPSVPVTQKDYRDNAVYNAAVYLKNKVVRSGMGEKPAVTGPAPLPPMTGMVRLITAIKPMVPVDQLPKLWEVIANELHWTDAQKERLQKLVEEAQPLFAVRTPKGTAKPLLRIVQPRHSVSAEVGEEKTVAA